MENEDLENANGENKICLILGTPVEIQARGVNPESWIKMTD